MGNVIESVTPDKYALTSFQKKKLLYEFHTFFDVNKDGCLDYHDFQLAREYICKISGWHPDDRKYKQTKNLFLHIWTSLRLEGDADQDEKITVIEWIRMWERFKRELCRQDEEKKKHFVKKIITKAKSKDGLTESLEQQEPEPEKGKLPEWLYSYLIYRFNMLDRTGDGVIDSEEFEYVLSDFNIPLRETRQAWIIISQNNTKKLDFPHFCQLAEEYYLSDDPASLGNFFTGKLTWDDLPDVSE